MTMLKPKFGCITGLVTPTLNPKNKILMFYFLSQKFKKQI